MKYYATFASGFQEIVTDLLSATLPDCKIIQMLDGAVIFECDSFPDLKFANNVFTVVHMEKNFKIGLNGYLKKLLSTKLCFAKNTEKQNEFRIITSRQNQLIAVNNNLKQRLEQIISKVTNAKLNRLGGGVEYWLLERSEGILLFLKRLTRHKDYTKILNKGELQPPIAYMLNFLSEPKQNELYLDPFCGYGMLPISRIENFLNARVCANDVDNIVIEKFKKKPNVEKIKIYNEDFFTYDFEGLIFDKIVTDPPWGKFDLSIDINLFYKNFFEKVNKILKQNGILVLLTARDVEIVEYLKNFKIKTKAEILISGKKANVYKLVKLQN